MRPRPQQPAIEKNQEFAFWIWLLSEDDVVEALGAVSALKEAAELRPPASTAIPNPRTVLTNPSR